MLQQLVKYLSLSRRLQLLCILSLMLTEALFASISIAMLIPITRAVLGSGEDNIGLSKYVPEWMMAQPGWLISAFGGLLLVKVLVTMARQGWSAYVTEKLRTEWQVNLAERLIYCPYAFIVRSDRGAMISDLTQQTNTGASFVLRYLTYVSDIITFLALLAVMVFVQWKIAILLPIAALVGWYTVGRPYYRMAQRFGRRGIGYSRALVSELIETLSGIKDVKITNSEAIKVANIKEIARAALVNKLWTRMAGAAPGNAVALILGIGIILALGFVGPDREQLNRALPLVIFFSAGAYRTVNLAAKIAGERFTAVNQLPAFIKVSKGLLPKSDLNPPKKGRLQIKRVETAVRFENVDFSYSPVGATPVLHNFDFELPRSKVVCLFGASGAGKTTIVDLIMRLHDVDSGQITANGRDIREFDLQAWRKLIGYVGQDPYLFSGTIEDNVRLENSTFTAEEIRAALSSAAVLEFVETLPEGIKTAVGSQGAALSGGQKRRIALARALVRKPDLLILDETTNALDEEMEARLIAALSKTGNMSILMISHRAVSAQRAHLSFMLENGQLRSCTGPEFAANPEAVSLQETST